MGRYLTNTELKNKARCEYAAQQSGMKVEFRDYPMPAEPDDMDDDGVGCYNPDSLRGVYGSVYTHQPFEDHSTFWRAWDNFDTRVSQ